MMLHESLVLFQNVRTGPKICYEAVNHSKRGNYLEYIEVSLLIYRMKPLRALGYEHIDYKI